MEVIRDRLSDEMMKKYRNAYRTLSVAIDLEAPCTIHFKDGTVLAERDLITSSDLFFIWLLAEFIPFAKTLRKPWILVHGDAVHLNDLKFSKEETETIRREGLNIFMYEPLFILNRDRSWPWNPSSGAPHYADLELVTDFYNKIAPRTNFQVFLCENGLSRQLNQDNQFPGLHFKDFSTLVMHEVHFNATHSWPLPPFSLIEKKLLCLNFRYEPVREMLAAFLRAQNFHLDSHLSYYHRHLPKEFAQRNPFDPSTIENWPLIKKGIELMQPELPYTLDVQQPRAEHPVAGCIPDLDGQHNLKDHHLMRHGFYPKVFAFCYCESRPFSPRSEISEKTIDPILAMKPFVIFAGRYFLKNLRVLGFKTFSDFWDESYDELEDPGARFNAFLNSVRHIAKQDLSTLKQWGEKMAPILEHNRLHMIRNLVSEEKARIQKELRNGIADVGPFY